MSRTAPQPVPQDDAGTRCQSKWLWLILTIVYALLMLKVSLTPYYQTSASSAVSQTIHNALHIPAYSVLTFFLVSSLRRWRFVRDGLWAFAVAAVYGGVLELLQNSVPGRSMSLSDALFNMFGAGLMLFIIRFLDRKQLFVVPAVCRAKG